MGTGDFWEPLARAATLGQLGRVDAGREAARELLQLKPDVAARARILIGHWVKFDTLLEDVVTGLRNVGVDIAAHVE